MISKNKEKEFSILAVASITENCLLGNPDEVFELCSFITGENVTLGNISTFANKIKSLIYAQYPSLNVNYVDSEINMAEYTNELNQIKLRYIKKYGQQIKIKSLKKIMVKELKLTR